MSVTEPTHRTVSTRRGNRRSAAGWLRLLGVAAVLAAAGAPGVRAELLQLTLFEKPAQSDLVVRGRVIRGDLRLAEVAVEEVLKGEYERPSLFVVFRLDNFTRKNWEEKVLFRNGEPVLLFLKIFAKESGEKPYADRFSLVRGVQGKVDLPAEGAAAILDATRRFVRVQAQTDIEQSRRELAAFLEDPNPLVVEAGLQEVHRLRLALEKSVPRLLRLLDHPSPVFRQGALRILGQVLDRRTDGAQSLPNEDHVVSLILGRAREDETVEVRVEAVRALEARGKRDVVAVLEQIARTDPRQSVRFEAGLAVYELKRGPAVEIGD
jgi:hypothetical protein